MTAVAVEDAPAAVVQLPVADLTLGLDFRLDEDTDDLAELAVSISEIGVLQPLIVRQTSHGWEVIAGRRRLSAARIVGLDTVPCILRSLDDDAAADVALAENLHRRDLSPIEVGLALARLRDEHGLSVADIAQRIGRSAATVYHLLQALTLPEHLRGRVHRREITVKTALDLNGRRAYKRQGGVSTKGTFSDVDANEVTYWRRRHDRLQAGIVAILRRRPDSGLEAFALLRALLDRDNSPLNEGQVTS